MADNDSKKNAFSIEVGSSNKLARSFSRGNDAIVSIFKERKKEKKTVYFLCPSILWYSFEFSVSVHGRRDIIYLNNTGRVRVVILYNIIFSSCGKKKNRYKRDIILF